MTSIKAIQTFFARDDKFAPGGGRPVPAKELQALDAKERAELGRLCCEAMGEPWEPGPVK